MSAACSGSRGVLRLRQRLLDLRDALIDGGIGGALHVRIDRRVDLQPALLDALVAELLDELAAHFVLEVLAVRFLGSAGRRRSRSAS